MNFKSLIIGSSILMLSVAVFAQTFEIEKARSEYGKYITFKKNPAAAGTAIKAAKESIDKAVAHKKTSTNPEAWTYKALIDAEMALADSTSNTNPNPLVVSAQEAIKKAKELDTKGEHKNNIDAATNVLYNLNLTNAIKLFNGKKYAEAYPEFVKGLNYLPGDTISNYYAGASAQNSKNYPAAIQHYTELLKTNFSYLPDVYANLAETYVSKGDTTMAIKTLGDASSKYPQNQNLVEREIQLSLTAGKGKEIIQKIEAQVVKNPTAKIFPFYLGLAYNAEKNYAKAEEAYKKAVAIDPQYQDAYINLGTVIMNNGIEIYNKANSQYNNKKLTPAQLAEYNKIKAKATAEFERALPFLEKAVELNPKSKLALNNLRYYYSVRSNNAKVAEIDAKINAL